MRFTTKWKDYELLDASNGERLERWGDVILIRPDPQIIWNTPKTDKNWQNPNAIYHRSSSGGGKWEVKNIPKNVWNISYKNLNFNVKMMSFKHTGVFPEQAVNWDLFREIISKRAQKTNVLNLLLIRAALLSPVPKRVQMYATSMPPKAWFHGREKMQNCRIWKANLFAG